MLEDLRVQSLSRSARESLAAPGRNVRQKVGLNRGILDQSWGGAGALLAYKLAERGGALVPVPAAYSSQICSACGHVATENRRT